MDIISTEGRATGAQPTPRDTAVWILLCNWSLRVFSNIENNSLATETQTFCRFLFEVPDTGVRARGRKRKLVS